MTGRLATGASCVLLINGRAVGRVAGFSWDISTPESPIHAVDSVLPYGAAPGPAIVTGTVTLWRAERDGGAEGAGLTAPMVLIPRRRYCSLELIDRRHESILFSTDTALVTDQRWQAPIRGLVQGSVTFVALVASNEAG